MTRSRKLTFSPSARSRQRRKPLLFSIQPLQSRINGMARPVERHGNLGGFTSGI
jgi:hypothetical protein